MVEQIGRIWFSTLLGMFILAMCALLLWSIITLILWLKAKPARIVKIIFVIIILVVSYIIGNQTLGAM